MGPEGSLMGMPGIFPRFFFPAVTDFYYFETVLLQVDGIFFSFAIYSWLVEDILGFSVNFFMMFITILAHKWSKQHIFL